MKIGFVGLGAMGFGMASNLASAGHDLGVLAHRNRAPLDLLIGRGAREHRSGADLAADSELVILCLPDSDVVEQVVDDMSAGLRPGLVMIDTGTSSLASTARLSERLGALGVEFAEAPLTGGIAQSAAGELGALVGADEALFTRIEPVLRDFCATVRHFGPVGAGGRAKLVNNYMVLGIAALVFEAFHAADLAHSDWAKLFDVVQCGSADSGVFRRIIGGALEGDFKRYVFDVKSAHKDMRYVTEMNRSLGLDSPLNQAVLEVFRRAEADGYGGAMISELLRTDIRQERGGV